MGGPNLRALLDGGIVWDNHACMPLRAGDASFLPELARVREAGVDVLSLNIAFSEHDGRAARAVCAAFREWVEKRSQECLLVGSVGDVQNGKDSGRLGICFDMEGMNALDRNVDEVRAFYDLGVRWMLVAYNQANEAGGGCLSEDRGLTPFGRRVIREMNEVGMVVCGSHCGYRTAREAIDLSAQPTIFSHSNPRGKWDHPRNIPDDLMKACASRGGVIGINGFGPFMGPNDARTITYVEHLEYALALLGDDHVGIALDYVFDPAELDGLVASDPVAFPPKYYATGANMVEPWRLPEIAQCLIDRGHSIDTLRKVFGANHLRIATQVWR
jgi:membrane dipeptidase